MSHRKHLRKLLSVAAIGASALATLTTTATSASAQVHGAGVVVTGYGAPVMDVNGVIRLPVFQVPVQGALGWEYRLQSYYQHGARVDSVRNTELWLLPNGGLLLNDGCLAFSGRWWNAPGVQVQGWLTGWCAAIDHQSNAIGRALQGPVATSYDGTNLYVQGGSYTLHFVRVQSFAPTAPPVVRLYHPAPQVAFWGNWNGYAPGVVPWAWVNPAPMRVSGWVSIPARAGHHDGSWVLSSTTLPYTGSAVGNFRLNLAANGTWTARPSCNWYAGGYESVGTELSVSSNGWYASGCGYGESSFDKGLITELTTAYYATSDATTLNITTNNGVLIFTRAS